MTGLGTKYVLANNFIFDPYNNTLLDQANDHTLIRLGTNESRILFVLIEHAPNVVSRDELHQLVWRDQGFQVDDSSLTQAISTLRKLLNDPPKSPHFIKTVPKRGYQLIAKFDQSTPVSTLLEEENAEDLSTSDLALTLPESGHQEVEAQMPESYQEQAQQKHQLILKEPMPLWAKCLWVLAFVLPLAIVNLPDSDIKDFVLVKTIDDVKVYTPTQNPQIKPWIPVLERCIHQYLEKNAQQKPSYIIVSGGQNESIGMNYIFSANQAQNSKSYQVYSKNPQLSPACR